MPLLILRPLVTAIIEYGLAFRVFKKGHFLPIATTVFLIGLATYQFGEYFFLSRNDRTWLAISLFATTMLPPYGLLLIEKLSHRKTFYVLFIVASLIFGLTFLFFPQVVPQANECNCFAKFDSSSLMGAEARFFKLWGWYYFLCIALSMFLVVWHIIKKHGDTKNLVLFFIGYMTFAPSSVFLIYITKSDDGLTASVMCALAIIAAFMVTHISIYTKSEPKKVTNLRVKRAKKRSK